MENKKKQKISIEINSEKNSQPVIRHEIVPVNTNLFPHSMDFVMWQGQCLLSRYFQMGGTYEELEQIILQALNFNRHIHPQTFSYSFRLEHHRELAALSMYLAIMASSLVIHLRIEKMLAEINESRVSSSIFPDLTLTWGRLIQEIGSVNFAIPSNNLDLDERTVQSYGSPLRLIQQK